VSVQRSRRKAVKAKRSAHRWPEDSAEWRAWQKVRRLWQRGDLFHVTNRFPRKLQAPRIDRLAGILKSGLVAPGCCQDGSVRSDLHILMEGGPVPYDRLVFLHRFGNRSWLYTICEPGRFAVFVDRKIPVLRPKDMGSNWPELCQDEVYVRDGIALEKLIAIAIHPEDADSIMSELLDDFRRAAIPLYDYEGKVLWPAG
jgi:hypothetical protein